LSVVCAGQDGRSKPLRDSARRRSSFRKLREQASPRSPAYGGCPFDRKECADRLFGVHFRDGVGFRCGLGISAYSSMLSRILNTYCLPTRRATKRPHGFQQESFDIWTPNHLGYFMGRCMRCGGCSEFVFSSQERGNRLKNLRVGLTSVATGWISRCPRDHSLPATKGSLALHPRSRLPIFDWKRQGCSSGKYSSNYIQNLRLNILAQRSLRLHWLPQRNVRFHREA